MPAYVGTSGWNYKHWRKIIYPDRVAQRRWLGFIASQFDSVEINTSYYAIPKPQSVTLWQQETPAGFLFALKMWRGITHYRKLLNTGPFLERFFEMAEALQPERRAPILMQLPPNQSKDLDKLEAFLHEFRSIGGSNWRLAAEFRHDSWLANDTNQLLDRHGVALCLHDMQGRAAAYEPNGAPFAYVRRHGWSYGGTYSPEQIQADASRISSWVKAGKNVYIYYNNDIGGHAYWNAQQLRKQLSLSKS